MKKIVFGIIAHVDSGKTTLSEAILYNSGEIRKIGRVDHRDAFLDTDKIERARGITIFSKQARFKYNECEFVLLDTPGHVDFSAETERTLQVIDYAVLVVSGSDGVHSHTKTLWRVLEKYKVPTFIFVNKMDLSDVSRQNMMLELRAKLSTGVVDFTDVESEKFLDDIAMCNEQLMQSVIENACADKDDILCAVQKREVFPCCFGSALKNNGVSELLDLLCEYSNEKSYGDQFGAKVYKISEGENGTRLTHMRITGGSLLVRNLINDEKVNEIRMYSGEKFKQVGSVSGGDICAVTGLEKTFVGQGIGFEKNTDSFSFEPVFNFRVVIKDGTNIHTALEKLRKLEQEETQLHVFWNERLQEINIQLMGKVQQEVLKSIISDRYKMDVEFEKGSIIYKETIEKNVEGVGHFEPLRHYAEVHLLLEPQKRGTGISFATDCPEDSLSKNWQRLIMTHLTEKTYTGVLTDSPLTDVKITLIAGRAHQKHTEGGDFRQATYRAVRQGLMQAESILLEPWYSFSLTVPQENTGRALMDLQNMGAEFQTPNIEDDMSVISGRVAVSKIDGYHGDVVAYTHGHGVLNLEYCGYDKCTEQESVVSMIGYNCGEDVENTADSVFCSHGTGFIVKWNEVDRYMHIPTRKEKNEALQNIPIRQYAKQIAGDDELLAIFEKTYGKIQRREYDGLYTSKPIKEKEYKVKKDTRDGNYLLVDGYNIIFAWDELKAVAQQNIESARMLLCDRLCNYAIMKQADVILVFDAYKVKGNHGSVEKYNNITVVYTKEAETADAYIERVTHEMGKKHRVKVATSDNLEQLIILGNGALRVSAREFYNEVIEVEGELQSFINSHNTKWDNKIGDVIDIS